MGPRPRMASARPGLASEPSPECSPACACFPFDFVVSANYVVKMLGMRIDEPNSAHRGQAAVALWQLAV